MNLILASKSPRRREILENLGIPFRIFTADTDENCDEKDPEKLVELLAERKGMAVFDMLLSEGHDMKNTVVLASDTVVAVDGEILGKPRDAQDAARMLRLLSGRSHTVHSGISLIAHDRAATSHETTVVHFDPLDDATIAHYIDLAQPYDKAGAYAIQGHAAAFISGIEGCYFNVVGLPVHRLATLWNNLFGEKIL